MKKLLLIYFIFPFLFLSGCASTPEQVMITKKEYVVKEPPEKLLEPIKVPRPPFVEDYLKLSPTEKEEALTAYINNLLNKISIHNNNLGLVKDWYAKQEAIYESKN